MSPTDDELLLDISAQRHSTLWKRVSGNRFLFISIAVHLLLGLGATAFVVQRFSATRKLTFKGGPPSPNRSTRAMEHKVQMAKKQSTMSAPATKRVVSTGFSKVTLPEMPAMPTAATAPSKMAGAGGAGIGVAGGPMGAASSQSGGGPVSLFGLRDARFGGLAGTFYDLKQTKEGKPSELAEDGANKGYAKEMEEFHKAGWNEARLQKYFKGPNPLFATRIFMPIMSAGEGPKAFDLADKVQPKRWAVLYKGKVTPPESGKFAFVGGADDVIMVRLNGRVVLDGGIFNPTGERPKQVWKDAGTNIPHSTKHGEKFEVSAGKSYDLQVLIGEIPGGGFHAWLLLEKEGENPAKDAKGDPILPIFKLGPSDPPTARKAPTVAVDATWSMWKAEKSDSGSSPLDVFRKK